MDGPGQACRGRSREQGEDVTSGASSGYAAGAWAPWDDFQNVLPFSEVDVEDAAFKATFGPGPASVTPEPVSMVLLGTRLRRRRKGGEEPSAGAARPVASASRLVRRWGGARASN